MEQNSATEKRVWRTHNVDELDHGETELDWNRFTEVADGTNEWVVSVTLEQRVHKLHFVVAAQTCNGNTHTAPNFGGMTN